MYIAACNKMYIKVIMQSTYESTYFEKINMIFIKS